MKAYLCAVALTVIAAFALVGCGSDPVKSDSPDTTVDTSDSVRDPVVVSDEGRIWGEYLEVDGYEYVCIVFNDPMSGGGGIWCERGASR